jgi:hypothetical protein
MQIYNRWSELRPHITQSKLWHSTARFVVVSAGRRSGKTELAKRKLVYRAMTEWAKAAYHRGIGKDLNTYRDFRYFACAPTRDQANTIFWLDIQDLVKSFGVPFEINKTRLSIKMFFNDKDYGNYTSEIIVKGLDVPQRIEGVSWNGGILDEYADMKESVWSEHVRPGLSDRKGWCWFTGVPEGRNHYYDLYCYAKAREANGDNEWACFTWKTAEIVDKAEVESAKAFLDPIVFIQEYEGAFTSMAGLAYYQFNEEKNIKDVVYDPRLPIKIAFDFNVSPGVAVISQEQEHERRKQTCVIGEVYIPRGSNTNIVCERIKADWGHHKGEVYLYGDATGASSGTSRVMGSDWDLIKNSLKSTFVDINFRVPNCNPREKIRVNAVNSRLMNANGISNILINPNKAPNLIKDFQGVVFLEGGSGELDKKSNPKLTHMTDAIGYQIVYDYPMVQEYYTGRLLFT